MREELRTFIHLLTGLLEVKMSVESKLTALLTGQQAILNAVQASSGGTASPATTAALAAIKTELDAVNATIGSETSSASGSSSAAGTSSGAGASTAAKSA